MKVILLQDIKSLGRKGELKEVKTGYARNFLIPKKLAEIANPEALARWQKEQRQKQEQEEKDLEKFKQWQGEINQLVFEAELEQAKDGSVFAGVSKQMINRYLVGQGIGELAKDAIELEHSLKDEGEYKIKINLGKGLAAELKISIKHKKT
ncbi:MAG: 50S ribosomal protein L9 [Patescibacteria group bacterium]